MRLIYTPLFAALLAAGAAPALANDGADASAANEKVNAIIVYGKDECPKPVGDEITICARKPEAERFRIPQGLRETPSANSQSWNSRVMAYERVGKTGTLSCTPVGAGGWTGCSQRLIDQAYAEKRGESDVTFAKIIEEERGKRLATLDGDAAATQSRVEQAEKDNEARRRAEQDGTPLPPLTNPPAGK